MTDGGDGDDCNGSSDDGYRGNIMGARLVVRAVVRVVTTMATAMTSE